MGNIVMFAGGIISFYCAYLAFIGKKSVRFQARDRSGAYSRAGYKEEKNADGRYIKSFISFLVFGVIFIFMAIFR